MHPIPAAIRALLPAAALGAFAHLVPAPGSDPDLLPHSPAASRTAALAAHSGSATTAEALLANARQLADAAAAAPSVAAAHALTARMQASLDALADLPGAADFPWQEWLPTALRHRQDEGLSLFLAAHRADPIGSLDRARTLEDRTTPTALRLACHRIFWARDPELALQRGRLLIRERERGVESLHRRYVLEVLAHQFGPQAKELLLEILHRNSLDGAARRAAVDCLVARRAVDTAADMASLYRASTGDLMVRKAGLLATLALAPDMGRQLLLEDVPQRDTHPGLYALVRELRHEHGLPALP